MPNVSHQPLVFHYALRSDVGLVRENNEDSAYADGDFLALADGMGGHSSGEVASAVAIRTLANHLRAQPAGFTQGADRTRRILQHMSIADKKLATMGTTLVGLQHHDGQFYIGHIGDSRLYTLIEDSLTQITVDHTHVQHLVNTGRITPEQVHSHPLRAMLLKSLDDQPGGADPDLIPVDLNEGDRVLLCSDGLSDYVADEAIQAALNLPNLNEAADALVEAALVAGTRDNVTVIVADVTRQDPPLASYGGAAEQPIAISPQAADALAQADPEYVGPIEVTPDPANDPLTPTQVLPQTGRRAAHPNPAGIPYIPDGPFPVAGMLAAGAVLVVGAAVVMIL